MKQFSAIVVDPIGLHARPASELVKISSQFQSTIKIICKGREGNAKSIMNVMALGIKQGDEFIVEADGDDESQAIEKIKEELSKLKLID